MMGARTLPFVAVAIALAACAGAPAPAPTRVGPSSLADNDYLARTDYEGCTGDRASPADTGIDTKRQRVPILQLMEAHYRGASAVVRYANDTTDSIGRPDRIIMGPHTGLCWPSAIAQGPKGELYVLNQAPPDASRDSSGRWKSWMTVYDSSASGDATPVRTLDMHTRFLGNPISFTVDRNGLLYAGSGVAQIVDAGSIAIFEAGADGNAEPLRVIAGPRTGLRRPADLAIDRRGYVYVTNAWEELALGVPPGFLQANGVGFGDDDAVRVFAPATAGDVEPDRLIAGGQTGLHRPDGLVLDRKDRLYVANAGDESVTVYDPRATGNVTPKRGFTDRRISRGMAGPRRLALDSHDSLYVSSGYKLSVFALGSADTTGPSRAFQRHAPAVFVLDRHDTLYALAGDTIKVYPPGYAGGGSPVRTIGGPRTGIESHGVTDMALDRHGWLYVALRSSMIRVFAPGASGDVPPARTIAGSRTGIRQPNGIALDQADRLYVTSGLQLGSGGAIRIYAAGARGEDQPIRTIWGKETRLSLPVVIELDSRGNLFVSNTEFGTPGWITVYRREAYGNEAPIRTIIGPQTQLRDPVALAFGRADTLYALNASGGRCRDRPASATMTAYAPGADGDVEPVRRLVLLRYGRSQGFKQDLRGLHGLAVDTTGAVELWHERGAVMFAPGASGIAAPARVIAARPLDGSEPSGVMRTDDGRVYRTNVPSYVPPAGISLNPMCLPTDPA